LAGLRVRGWESHNGAPAFPVVVMPIPWNSWYLANSRAHPRARDSRGVEMKARRCG
jgi:hypothetical protein